MNVVQSVAISFLLGAFWQPACATDDEGLAITVKFYSTELLRVVDQKRWEIKTDSASILIKSKFKVDILQRIAPVLGEKPTPEIYRIELRFKPKFTKDEFINLAKERVGYAAIVNYGAKTKMEWSNAQKFLTDNPLPRYSVPYSVYVATTDSVSITIIPAEKYAEVKGVEALVDQLFWPCAE